MNPAVKAISTVVALLLVALCIGAIAITYITEEAHAYHGESDFSENDPDIEMMVSQDETDASYAEAYEGQTALAKVHRSKEAQQFSNTVTAANVDTAATAAATPAAGTTDILSMIMGAGNASSAAGNVAQTAATQTAADNASSSVMPTPVADTLYIKGEQIPFRETRLVSVAPQKGAGLWNGSASTTDGSWGYFIGHNPGSFTAITALQNGDTIAVCDDAGNARTYKVIDAYEIPNTTYWEQLQPNVTGYGESIILQTCMPGDQYLIVVAQAA